MKFFIKFLCILFVCLSLSSCMYWDYWFYSTLNIPDETIANDDVNCFLDGSYIELSGGDEAAAFFNKYVKLDKYKDIAFHYRYHERATLYYMDVLYDATVFVVDVYYEENDFWNIVEQIAPYNEHPEEVKQKIIDYIENDQFYGINIEDNSLNLDNSYYVWFDAQHFTVRYTLIYGYYTEDFRGIHEQFVRGKDDTQTDIDKVLRYLVKLKWNSPNYHYIEGEGLNEIESPEDWIFDYSDIIDTEASDETSSRASE